MSTISNLEFMPMLVTEVFREMKAAPNWFDLSKARRAGTAEIPYVARSGGRNGIATFLPDQGFEPPNPGNVISVGVSTATVFYQPVPFYTSKEIQTLSHPRLSPQNGPVLVALLREQMGKFRWGNGASLARLRATRIMVPVINSTRQEVDWDGIDRLADRLSQQVLTTTRSVLGAEGTETALAELAFKPLLIIDVFEQMYSSAAWYDKTALATTGQPRYPFVSRTRSGNGVDGFCPRQEKAPEPGSAITIGLDTQTVGFQPVSFYTSQNIQVLRHPKLDEHSGLVLVALIRSQMGKFGWGGNGATLGRLRRTRILVPVDEAGEIDWERLSSYGRALRAQTELSVEAIFA